MALERRWNRTGSVPGIGAASRSNCLHDLRLGVAGSSSARMKARFRAVSGPRVSRRDGIEAVSTRRFWSYR